jgi:hypothetical protein
MDDYLSTILTDLQAACDKAETLEQVEALMGTLTSHLRTLPKESVEARRVTSVLAELGLKKKMMGPIVAVEPVGGGVNKGKLKLTFPDGTHAIFKPASGEAGDKPKD